MGISTISGIPTKTVLYICLSVEYNKLVSIVKQKNTQTLERKVTLFDNASCKCSAQLSRLPLQTSAQIPTNKKKGSWVVWLPGCINLSAM